MPKLDNGLFVDFPVFPLCDHKIVLQIKIKQFYGHVMQKLVKTGKNTNQQTIRCHVLA